MPPTFWVPGPTRGPEPPILDSFSTICQRQETGLKGLLASRAKTLFHNTGEGGTNVITSSRVLKFLLHLLSGSLASSAEVACNVHFETHSVPYIFCTFVGLLIELSGE